MIKNKKKIIALAMAMSVIVPSVVYAASGSLSYGAVHAKATLRTSSSSGQGRAKARTEFNSSNHSGYKVTAYSEARNNSGTVSQAFDTGFYWAETNSSAYNVNSFGSTHTISSASNVYNHLDLVQLGE